MWTGVKETWIILSCDVAGYREFRWTDSYLQWFENSVDFNKPCKNFSDYIKTDNHIAGVEFVVTAV